MLGSFGPETYTLRSPLDEWFPVFLVQGSVSWKTVLPQGVSFGTIQTYYIYFTLYFYY